MAAVAGTDPNPEDPRWWHMKKPLGAGVKVPQPGAFHRPDFHIHCILDLPSLFIFLSRTPLRSYFDSVGCLRM